MSTKGIRGIHVFWMIFGFFTVVIGVDVFFITRAIGTFPGEQVKNSYVLGLNYNREVERREQQADLGWSVKAGVPTGNDAIFMAQFADRAGQPVTGLVVSTTYFSAGAGNAESEIELREGRPGEYSAAVSLSAQRADFQIRARRVVSGPVVFEAAKAVVLP